MASVTPHFAGYGESNLKFTNHDRSPYTGMIRMFGTGCIKGLALTDKPLAMCRGDLYCYLAFELDEDSPHIVPGAIFSCGGLELPVPVYPLEEVLGAEPRRWVAVFPHKTDEDQRVTVIDRATGRQIYDYRFSYADMKWQSRLAYRIRKSLATRMRDIDQLYWSTGILIELVDVFSASADEQVMRLDLVFPYAHVDDVIDTDFMLAQGSCSQVIVMEDGLGNDGKRHVSLSMRVACDDPGSFVFAQDSREPGCRPGLLVVDAPMRAEEARRTREWMASADADPTYPHWLLRHRAQAFQLSAQRSMSSDWSVGVLMVIDRIDTSALAQSLAALGKQSTPVRGLCLMGAGAKRAKTRVRSALQDYGLVEVVQDADQAIGLLGTDYLFVMDQHDILEPNALYELALCLREDGDALLAYADDDQVDRALAVYRNPRLKPDIDIDALYAGNYIGSCALLRANAFGELALANIKTAEQLIYAASLELCVRQGAIVHAPRVLCHRRERKGDLRTLKGDPGLLAEHLHARNVSAHITRDDAYNRVIYETSEPQKLVSIIIPTKDHASMLDDCVSSILEKAGYDTFEIILVENNSTQPETLAFYEEVTKRDARVKVVTYEGAFNFSKIVNYGVSQSSGELVLTLNNDTKAITDGFLDIMAGYFERPEVGVVGPMLRYPDGLVQNAGIALMTSGCLGFMNQNRAPEYDQGYLGSLAHPREYSAVLGACLMVRRDDFDAVGGFTEELAVTYNDVDFCWKLRERGLRCVFTPYAELYHLEFASRGRDRVNEQRAIQTELEAGIMRQRWPRYFACGDPVYNPACSQVDPNFKLGR